MDAIYARQSVEKKDSLSIEGQIELCRKFTQPDALVFQDKGFSGKNTKRPAFAALMQAVEMGKIQKIVVYRIDRFSRSLADFTSLWELLRENGVAFQSVTEQFDTSSPMGRAMLHIVMTFAQLERETTAERVRDNYVHRVSLGAWPGGPAPYGYTLSRTESEGRRVSTLTADENAVTVRRIFEEYDKPETTLRSLARILTGEGIHGPKRAAWDNVTLSRILHSPVYVRADEAVYLHFLAQGTRIQAPPEAFDGVHACLLTGRRCRSGGKYNRQPERLLSLATHEGVVPAPLWLRVQDKLSSMAQLPRANAGKYSWLTGLLKCAKCGYAVKVNYLKSEQRCKLVCSGRSNFGSCAAAIDVDLRELEEHIARELQHMLDACLPELPAVADHAQAEAALAVEQKIDRLVMALAESSDISAAYIARQIERLHAERERLLRNADVDAAQAAPLCFSTCSFEEKKRIAAECIRQIELDGSHANIVWNF